MPDQHSLRSCGVTLMSDRRLPGLRPAPPDAPIDLVLTESERSSVPTSFPDLTELVVDPDERHSRFYAAGDSPEGYNLRFFGQCDVTFDHELTRASYRLDPAADEGFVEVLMAGTMIAFVAAMRGGCVLHASAVEVGGRGLAFVGHSGMGKSTLAVLACAAGARLLAEDVLVVESGSPPVGLPGNTDIRLKKGSAHLAEHFAVEHRSATPDGREAIRPALATQSRVPLDAIVIPRPSRAAQRVSYERLEPTKALFRVMNYPRVNGLKAPRVVRAQFAGVGDIVRNCPVYVATVPWGAGLSSQVGEDLLALAKRPA